MTTTLEKLVHEKAVAYYNKLYRQNQGDQLLKENFKNMPSFVKREIRKAKVKYHSNLLHENRDDPKKFWQLINEKRGKNVNHKITEITVGDKICNVSEHAIDIANASNEYFINVPEKLLKDNN